MSGSGSGGGKRRPGSNHPVAKVVKAAQKQAPGHSRVLSAAGLGPNSALARLLKSLQTQQAPLAAFQPTVLKQIQQTVSAARMVEVWRNTANKGLLPASVVSDAIGQISRINEIADAHRRMMQPFADHRKWLDSMMGGDTVISLIEQVREHLIVDPGLSSLKTALDALNATVTINAKIVAAPAWRGVAEAASFAAMVGSEAAVRRAENTFTVDGWLDIQDFISHAKRGEPINDSDVSRLYERIKESFTKALSGATSSVELRTHFASWGHFLSIILIILAILTIYQAYEIADQSSQALRDVKGEVQSQHELDRQQREELEKKRAEKESRFMELQEEANRLIREGNEIARRKIEERECQALYIVATPTTMTVNPDASSEQLVELCVGDEVELKEDAGDWIRALWYDALTGQEQLGWVRRSHVEQLDR